MWGGEDLGRWRWCDLGCLLASDVVDGDRGAPAVGCCGIGKSLGDRGISCDVAGESVWFK